MTLHVGMLYAHDREKATAAGSHGSTTASRVAKYKRNYLFLKVKYEVLKIVERKLAVLLSCSITQIPRYLRTRTGL